MIRLRPLAAGRTTVAALVAAACLAPVALNGSSAGAQSSSDLKAQARAIAERRAELRDRIGALEEDINDSNIKIEELNGSLAAAKSELAEAETEVAKARTEMQSFVVKSFITGTQPASAGDSFDVNEMLVAEAYRDTTRGERQDFIDRMRSSQADLGKKQADLDRSSKELTAQKASAEKAQSEITATETDLAKQETQIQGELKAALEREEEARQAAAEKAAREAAARAAAERSQREAAARSTAASASGGGTRVRQAQTRTQGAPARSSSGSSSAQAATTAAPKAAAPAPAPKAVAPPRGGGSAVSAALSMQGVPYRWGGSSPSGFDCSGLIQWAFAQAGRPGLPHSSRSLYGMGQKISVDQLVPGDLVAYGSPVHHIGIYIGNGNYVHAPHSGDVVKVSSIYRGSGPPMPVRI